MKEINPKDSKENVMINHKLLDNINRSLDTIDNKYESEINNFFEKNIEYLKIVKHYILTLCKDKYQRYIYNAESRLTKFKINNTEDIMLMDSKDALNLNAILREVELLLNNSNKNKDYFDNIFSSLKHSLNVTQKQISENNNLFDGVQGFIGYNSDKIRVETNENKITNLISRDEFKKNFMVKFNFSKIVNSKLNVSNDKSKSSSAIMNSIDKLKKINDKNKVTDDEETKICPELFEIIKDFNIDKILEEYNEEFILEDLFNYSDDKISNDLNDLINWRYFIGFSVTDELQNESFKIGFDDEGVIYDTRIDYKSINDKSKHIYDDPQKLNSLDLAIGLQLQRNKKDELLISIGKNGNQFSNVKLLNTKSKIRFFIILNKYEECKYSINFTELKKGY